MRILVTAGNTQAPIDRVRCITNIFTGRTGARIALHAHARGHQVVLLTSHPEVIRELSDRSLTADGWTLQTYRTFADLEQLLATSIPSARPDAIIHCAAVSDYLSAGVFAPAAGTRFDSESLRWQQRGDNAPALANRSVAKVKSDEPEIWLRLVRAPKLVDRMRSAWSFRGTLVKFKLEADVSEQELIELAEQSRRRSDADLMVANTLEGADAWAYLGPVEGAYRRIDRPDLPAALLEAIERLRHEEHHG